MDPKQRLRELILSNPYCRTRACNDEFTLNVINSGKYIINPAKGEIYSVQQPDKSIGSVHTDSGYRKLILKHNGQRKNIRIHRMIYISVYGVQKPDLQVDHINGDKLDNRIENLRSISMFSNLRSAVFQGKMDRPRHPETGRFLKSKEPEYPDDISKYDY